MAVMVDALAGVFPGRVLYLFNRVAVQGLAAGWLDFMLGERSFSVMLEGRPEGGGLNR